MKKLKKNNGITLIALVITIIIILILAGISLNASIGDNGIISKSQTAKLKKEISSVEEEVLTGIASLDAEYYKKISSDAGININDIYSMSGLQKYVNGKINGYLHYVDGSATVYYTNEKGSYTVKIDNTGKVTSYSGIYLTKNEINSNMKLEDGETITFSSEVEDVVWRITYEDGSSSDNSTGKVTRTGSGKITVEAIDLKSNSVVGKAYITEDVEVVTTNTDISSYIEAINLSTNTSHVMGYIIPNTSDSSKYTLVIKGSGDTGTSKLSASEKNDPYNKNNYKDKIIEIVVDNGVTSLTNSKIETLTNTKTITLCKTIQTFETVVHNLPIETVNYNIENYTREETTSIPIFSSTVKNVYFGSDVKSIPNHAFYQNKNIESVDLSQNIETIGNYAFYECSNLRYLNFGNSVTKIGDSAFYGNLGLNTITIPENVKSIGDFTFANCENVKTINYNAISCGTSYYNILNFIMSPLSGTMENVENLNIGRSVKKIPASLFSYAYKLTSIKIPNSVESIGEYAFAYSSNVESLELGNSLQLIDNQAFTYCQALTELTIPESVTSIDKYSFFQCTNIKKLNYNAINCTYDGLIDNGTTICGIIPFSQNSLQELNIGNKVEKIPVGIFSDLISLKQITIPDSVKIIEDYAFAFDTALERINIPINVESLGANPFYNCTSLTTLDYNAKNCSYTGYDRSNSKWISLFETNIKVINIGNQVEIIPNGIFAATSITSINIPDSVKVIDYAAFMMCTSLNNLTLGNGVEAIKDGAFQSCTSLTTLTLPKSLKYLYQYTFAGCTSLTTLNYNAENCNAYNAIINGKCYSPFSSSPITTINIGSTVKKINPFVFTDTAITSIVIPSNVESIVAATATSNGAFWGCDSLTSITVKKSKDSIGGAPWGASLMSASDVIWQP